MVTRRKVKGVAYKIYCYERRDQHRHRSCHKYDCRRQFYYYNRFGSSFCFLLLVSNNFVSHESFQFIQQQQQQQHFLLLTVKLFYLLPCSGFWFPSSVLFIPPFLPIVCGFPSTLVSPCAHFCFHSICSMPAVLIQSSRETFFISCSFTISVLSFFVYITIRMNVTHNH